MGSWARRGAYNAFNSSKADISITLKRPSASSCAVSVFLFPGLSRVPSPSHGSSVFISELSSPVLSFPFLPLNLSRVSRSFVLSSSSSRLLYPHPLFPRAAFPRSPRFHVIRVAAIGPLPRTELFHWLAPPCGLSPLHSRAGRRRRGRGGSLFFSYKYSDGAASHHSSLQSSTRTDLLLVHAPAPDPAFG